MTIDYGRIGTYDYRVVTEMLSESYDLAKQSLSYLFGMHAQLQFANVNIDNTRRVDLDYSIVKNYAMIIQQHFQNARSVFDAVRSLNEHVLTQYGDIYGYKNLDEFLTDQYLSVPLTYATLSASIGYPITVIGGEKGRYVDIGDTWIEIDKEYKFIGWENL